MELMNSDNIIQDRPKPQQEMQQQQQEQHHHFHVLAVDDSVIDRKLLEKLLKVSSYQVTCVDSGDKALEYLGLLNNLDPHQSTASSSSSSSPSSFSSTSFSCSQSSQQEGLKVNLIMTDFCMPGISGYDLLQRVKGSSWKDVPVVIMSSENEPSRISMCLEGGAEEFLLKPLQLSDLDKIQAYLLKSLRQNSCTNIHKDLIVDDDDNTSNKNSDDNSNENGNSNNNNNNFSKRKAISSEATEIRRPKMKGVAVGV
ncbi:two-component response regulator ORR9-like [Durio zibethinus]|uniref:Two-component response regulator ORR9-like n=1 Tax=Durio zibethinus TaxID=66656 RepID=A0A6P6ATL3_DURZI|nr:two-component response regulator ORR9-like [Durio zibethinus]